MANITGAPEGRKEITEIGEPMPAAPAAPLDVAPSDGASAKKTTEGFASEAAFEDYLDAVAEDVLTEETLVDIERAAAREELQRQIEDVRDEIGNLRARLHIIRNRAGSVVEENIRWADASAHAQLGDYPWLKLSGAMAAAFCVGKLLQRLPFGSLATAAAPLILAAARERRR
ncbi:quinol monooxygenase YgiN [Rhizobium sp. BK650]|uniref:hypothetical protein n=1 Tax=Rhizobium sp. BK650 TaxID=2586990 RepID=UPI00160B1B10|nr:hypothetical protein [Rhizobium sp. BK650]MBB3656589.1 quinol monooxygenase YgiN [Rhizobium sp. BK650]